MTSLRKSILLFSLAAFFVVALLSVGCAVQSNGMTLPNPYYQKNRVQYFPKGPEFSYAREAAEAEAAKPEKK
ncbi:MAG: hypothetical protein ACRC46_04315 [Thermoguttaceae bacterium]